MELDKATKVHIGNSGIIFLGEYGEIIGRTPFEALKGMIAGYTTHSICTNCCPFCMGRPDLSIPGFLSYRGKQPVFKLIIDRRRTIVKKLVNTVVNLKANPTHVLYITAINLNELEEPSNLDKFYIPNAEYRQTYVQDRVGYIFQITKYPNL